MVAPDYDIANTEHKHSTFYILHLSTSTYDSVPLNTSYDLKLSSAGSIRYHKYQAKPIQSPVAV